MTYISLHLHDFYKAKHTGEGRIWL